MRVLFVCLLLSTASLAKLVDDPECELNKGKLCPGGCCYDNQQVTRIYFAYLEAEIPTLCYMTKLKERSWEIC